MLAASSPYGIACIRCSEVLISPSCSEYVSEDQIRHFWFCDACGRQFERSDRPLGRSVAISATKACRESVRSW